MSGDSTGRPDKADRVVIGRGSPTAVFRSASRNESDDPHARSSFVVELHSDGLEAIRSVFMFSFDWDALANLSSDLASSWRGWDGEKSWESIEHDLTITTVSDSLGHPPDLARHSIPYASSPGLESV